MKMSFAMIALTTALAACGGSIPAPSNKLAAAEGGSRSASEVGANGVPDAALHLKMANDQIAQAKASWGAFGSKRHAAVARAT